MSWIDDGFPTRISFSDAASGVTILFAEKEVTPPGADGGGQNDTTTMRNTAWRTFAPKKLKTLTECTFTCKYDPALYDDIVTLLQDNQLITITFPDTHTLSFWGWIDKFIPAALTEGGPGLATITIVPSNQNESGVEVAPAYA